MIKIMRLNLSRVSAKIRNIIVEIGEMADRQDIAAYAVGGYVRDLILRRENLDLDIVVEGDAVAFAKLVSKAHKTLFQAYPQFKTATLVYAQGWRVDFATARREEYPFSGALPVVSEGSILPDLFRRDFTINAIAMKINVKDFGTWVDPYGGLTDIKRKTIRILHSKSFVDDPTRILRAVRFEQRFGFSLERNTLILLKQAIHQGIVNNVKAPRYFAEFRRILKEQKVAACLQRLKEFHGLDFLGEGIHLPAAFLRQIERAKEKWQRPVFYKDIRWDLLYLMSLVGKMNSPEVERFIARFQLTKLEGESLQQSLHTPEILRRLLRKNLQPSDVYQILIPCDDQVIGLMRVSSESRLIQGRIDNFVQKSRMTALHITGNDLREMGIKEGKTIGKVLQEVLLKKINGRIKNRREELNAAREFLKEQN